MFRFPFPLGDVGERALVQGPPCPAHDRAMSSRHFTVKEHIVEAQHIREYARATAHNQEERLRLAVKQYIPKNNPNPQPGDVTIIGAHANGFPKVRTPYVCT